MRPSWSALLPAPSLALSGDLLVASTMLVLQWRGVWMQRSICACSSAWCRRCARELRGSAVVVAVVVVVAGVVVDDAEAEEGVEVATYSFK